MVPEWVKKYSLYRKICTGVQKTERYLLRQKYKRRANVSRHDTLLKALQELPVSNGVRFYCRSNVNIGLVADRFVYENYAPTCTLVYLTPENWEQKLQEVDCLIVTSLWKGLQGEWAGVNAPDSACGKALRSMMRQAHTRGCPVIFYSKEDPPNFDQFCRFAGLADQIFTSAKECVSWYQEKFPEIPVSYLPFACSPQTHNPIGMRPLTDAVAALFAGSWMKKYPKRIQDQQNLFTWLCESGVPLDIIDRNYYREDSRYTYPDRFLPLVVPAFSYQELARLYKLYTWVLNFNSVIDSESMFAMRVYDVLACGTLVLSNESVGMQKLFPEVCVVSDAEQLCQVLKMPRQALEQRRYDGIRTVFRKETVYDNMDRMLSCVGLRSGCCPERTVGVLIADDVTDVQTYRAMFEAQTYADKLWLGVNADQEALSGCDMVALWGRDRIYGPCYLEDMINGFKYTDCDYVTKRMEDPLCQHRYTDGITDLYATVFWRDAYWRHMSDLGQIPCVMPKGYASDRNNYQFLRESNFQEQ